jgi:hypothetical protein
MAQQHDIDAQRLTNELEPLISGTLVLMTAMQQPGSCVHIPAKIVSNLERLTAHPRLSTEFRMVLERLRLHWQARCGTDVAAWPPMPGRAGRPVLH